MVVYLFMIAWCLVTEYIAEHARYKKKIYSVIPVLIIFIVSAIRYNVGSDYSGTYTGLYYRILSGDKPILELIPTVIYRLIIFLNLDLQWFFVITSFIFCFFIYKSINKQSNDKVLSYYLVICGALLFFAYNGIRQSLAMVIFYYSLNWIIEEKKNIKYWITNVFSFCIHTSGIVFLPLNLVLKKQFRTKTKIIFLLVILVLSQTVLPFLINIISRTRFLYYIQNADVFHRNALNLSNYINIILFLIYEYIFFKKKNVTSKDIVYGNIHFIGVIITFFVTSVPMAYRLFYAFRYIEYLSIPNLLGHCNKKYKKLLTLLVYCGYFAYFVYMIIIQHAHDSLPYLTIFDR